MAEPVSSTSPDDLYEQAAAIYDAALDRLARAYEADADKRRDLLQEIHLAMWRSFALYAQHCSLRTWVYQVAHNTAVSHIMRERRTYRGLVTLEEIDNLPAAAEDELGGIDRRSALERLFRLIHRLKPVDRQVILSYLEGMDAASISQITGISPGNVAMNVHRIKDLLARRFHEGGHYGK